MSELLPCPFCGKTPRIGKNEYLWRTDFQVRCPCGINAKPRETKKEAVRKWNTRVKETPNG